jgi:hypothetical protein
MDLFGDIYANTIYYKLGQSWASLTSTDSTVAFFREQSEYLNYAPRLLGSVIFFFCDSIRKCNLSTNSHPNY